MNQAVIRRAEQSDLSRLLELYHHLDPRDTQPDPAAAQGAWSTLLGSGICTVFVADVAGHLAASCALAVIPNLTRGARSYGLIENVVTDAAHRRHGLGSAVLHAALNAAWSGGCYKVMLASGRDEDTLRFYEKVGFKRGGKTFFEMRRL